MPVMREAHAREESLKAIAARIGRLGEAAAASRAGSNRTTFAAAAAALVAPPVLPPFGSSGPPSGPPMAAAHGVADSRDGREQRAPAPPPSAPPPPRKTLDGVSRGLISGARDMLNQRMHDLNNSRLKKLPGAGAAVPAATPAGAVGAFSGLGRLPASQVAPLPPLKETVGSSQRTPPAAHPSDSVPSPQPPPALRRAAPPTQAPVHAAPAHPSGMRPGSPSTSRCAGIPAALLEKHAARLRAERVRRKETGSSGAEPSPSRGRGKARKKPKEADDAPVPASPLRAPAAIAAAHVAAPLSEASVGRVTCDAIGTALGGASDAAAVAAGASIGAAAAVTAAIDPPADEVKLAGNNQAVDEVAAVPVLESGVAVARAACSMPFKKRARSARAGFSAGMPFSAVTSPAAIAESSGLGGPALTVGGGDMLQNGQTLHNRAEDGIASAAAAALLALPAPPLPPLRPGGTIPCTTSGPASAVSPRPYVTTLQEIAAVLDGPEPRQLSSPADRERADATMAMLADVAASPAVGCRRSSPGLVCPPKAAAMAAAVAPPGAVGTRGASDDDSDSTGVASRTTGLRAARGTEGGKRKAAESSGRGSFARTRVVGSAGAASIFAPDGARAAAGGSPAEGSGRQQLCTGAARATPVHIIRPPSAPVDALPGGHPAAATSSGGQEGWAQQEGIAERVSAAGDQTPVAAPRASPSVRGASAGHVAVPGKAAAQQLSQAEGRAILNGPPSLPWRGHLILATGAGGLECGSSAARCASQPRGVDPAFLLPGPERIQLYEQREGGALATHPTGLPPLQPRRQETAGVPRTLPSYDAEDPIVPGPPPLAVPEDASRRIGGEGFWSHSGPSPGMPSAGSLAGASCAPEDVPNGIAFPLALQQAPPASMGRETKGQMPFWEEGGERSMSLAARDCVGGGTPDSLDLGGELGWEEHWSTGSPLVLGLELEEVLTGGADQRGGSPAQLRMEAIAAAPPGKGLTALHAAEQGGSAAQARERQQAVAMLGRG